MEVDINKIDNRLLEEDDRIASYLKGRMSGEETQAFLRELEEKPDLKERAIIMARLVKGLKEVGTAQDKETIGAILASDKQSVEKATKNAFQKATEAQPAATKVVSMRKPAAWLSIAASLIFIVWLGIGYNDYRNTIGLGDEYGKSSFTAEMVSRGSATSSDVENKLERLFKNVQGNTDLAGTIHELSLCWELSTMESYNDYTDHSAEIGWNLAIAYLKDNDKKEALAVLTKMATLPGASIDGLHPSIIQVAMMYVIIAAVYLLIIRLSRSI